MNISLDKDLKKIQKHIRQRVRDYPNAVNAGPGEDSDPISLITLGYQFDQAGWIALVFDTRPGAEPDGEWNSYIEENAIHFEHWFDAFCDLEEGGAPIALTLHDGSQKTIEVGFDMADLAACFGKMLRDALIAARDNGEFAKLPLADRCIMSVEEHDGHYGWPEYDARLKEGRVK